MIYALIGSLILLVCIFCNKITSKVGLPSLLIFMVVGILFNLIPGVSEYFSSYNYIEIFCSFTLAIIIFYGGFDTNYKKAKKVLPQSILLSSLGVIFTVAITGLLSHYFLGFAWAESFLLAAVIGSTDAATVFSILKFKRLNLRYNTASLLEVESGSNDPWAYMLALTLIQIIGVKFTVGGLFLDLFLQIFVGLGIGVLIAGIGILILKYTVIKTQGFKGIIILSLALVAYTLPSLLKGNGYLSVYIVGIILGNIKFSDKIESVHFFDSLTGLFQIIVFFLMGVIINFKELGAVFFPAIIVFLVVTFLARPLSSLILLSPFKTKMRTQAIISCAGLKGASSIIFALFVLAKTEELGIKTDIFHITLVIALLSIAIQGTLLPYLSKKLDMIDLQENVFTTFNDYIEETEVKFILVEITADNIWNNKKISELGLCKDLRITLILRNEEKIIPRGDTLIQFNDKVILSGNSYNFKENILLHEIKVLDQEEYIDKQLSKITFVDQIIILIKRDDKIIIPSGEIVINKNDILVFVND